MMIGFIIVFSVAAFAFLIVFIVWLCTRFSTEGRIKHTQNKTKDWKVGDIIKVSYLAYSKSQDELVVYTYTGKLIAWHYKYVVVENNGEIKKRDWSDINNLSAKQRKEDAEMKRIMK